LLKEGSELFELACKHQLGNFVFGIMHEIKQQIIAGSNERSILEHLQLTSQEDHVSEQETESEQDFNSTTSEQQLTSVQRLPQKPKFQNKVRKCNLTGMPVTKNNNTKRKCSCCKSDQHSLNKCTKLLNFGKTITESEWETILTSSHDPLPSNIPINTECQKIRDPYIVIHNIFKDTQANRLFVELSTFSKHANPVIKKTLMTDHVIDSIASILRQHSAYKNVYDARSTGLEYHTS
jgi:hypothetical protein